MDKEKQIDEIAKLICTYPQCIHYNVIGECATTECQTVDIAENLYKQGYRKASDVAREIFAEIEETVKKAIRVCDRYAIYPMLREAKMGCYKDLLGYIEKLKKKYESEGTNRAS